METKKRTFKCTGCGDDRPCYVESNQEPNPIFDDLQIEDLKCVLDETNQTSYNWVEQPNQQPQSQSAEDYWHTKPKKFKEIVGYSTQHLLEFAKEYANQKALTVSDEWISVEDRFPEQDQSVLISDTNDVYKAWYSDKNFFVENFGEVDNVTHWQPLPTPPINKE